MYKTPFITAMQNRPIQKIEESTNVSLFNNSNYIASQCCYCQNLSIDGCSAFGNDIPKIIKENLHDHRFPYKDDNNISFEKSEKYKDVTVQIVSMDNTFPPKVWNV